MTQPRLRPLELTIESPKDVSRSLDDLIFPSIQDLVMKSTQRPWTESADSEIFISRSQCSIESLTLEAILVNGWDQYLRLFPYLTTICLTEARVLSYRGILWLLSIPPTKNGGAIVVPRLRALEHAMQTVLMIDTKVDYYEALFSLAARVIETRWADVGKGATNRLESLTIRGPRVDYGAESIPSFEHLTSLRNQGFEFEAHLSA